MAWLWVLVVVIGVGLPMVAWSITRRLPPPRHAVNRLGSGYDAVDKWLLDRYQLSPRDRWRGRTAVVEGPRVSDAALAQAAEGVPARGPAGGVKARRPAPRLGGLAGGK